MKRETIDGLLVDRALGELPPDVAELLTEYLGEHAELAARAASVDVTASLAQRVLPTVKGSPAATLPEPTWGERRQRSLRIFRTEWLPLAACLMLGLTVGWIGRGAREPARASAPRVALSSLAADDAPVRDAGKSVSFWSAASIAGHGEDNSAAPSRYRLRWDSPIRMPHLEEKP